MFRNRSNMGRLQEIFASEDGPENPKKHRKGEIIWAKGCAAIRTVTKPDLQDFPDDKKIVRYWDIGIKEAQEDLLSVGIVPDESKSPEENMWFYRPHVCGSTEVEASLNLETDACGNADEDKLSIPHQEDSIPVSQPLIDYSQQLGSHLRFVAHDIEREEIDIKGNTIQSVSTAKLTVNVNGIGEIHKSTVVSLLNSNPKGLSSD